MSTCRRFCPNSAFLRHFGVNLPSTCTPMPRGSGDYDPVTIAISLRALAVLPERSYDFVTLLPKLYNCLYSLRQSRRLSGRVRSVSTTGLPQIAEHLLHCHRPPRHARKRTFVEVAHKLIDGIEDTTAAIHAEQTYSSIEKHFRARRSRSIHALFPFHAAARAR